MNTFSFVSMYVNVTICKDIETLYISVTLNGLLTYALYVLSRFIDMDMHSNLEARSSIAQNILDF